LLTAMKSGSPRNPLIFFIWNWERTNNKQTCSSRVSVPCFPCWFYWSSKPRSVFLRPRPIIGRIYAHGRPVQTLHPGTMCALNYSWRTVVAHFHRAVRAPRCS
jgi:hypothetical protein